eukprot:7372326-Pyramimonas_sp.AAC.1
MRGQTGPVPRNYFSGPLGRDWGASGRSSSCLGALSGPSWTNVGHLGAVFKLPKAIGSEKARIQTSAYDPWATCWPLGVSFGSPN